MNSKFMPKKLVRATLGRAKVLRSVNVFMVSLVRLATLER